MSPHRLVGIVLLLVGVLLFMMGLNAPALIDQASSTVLARFVHGTVWHLLGGLVIASVGLIMVIFGGRVQPASPIAASHE